MAAAGDLQLPSCELLWDGRVAATFLGLIHGRVSTPHHALPATLRGVKLGHAGADGKPDRLVLEGHFQGFTVCLTRSAATMPAEAVVLGNRMVNSSPPVRASTSLTRNMGLIC